MTMVIFERSAFGVRTATEILDNGEEVSLGRLDDAEFGHRLFEAECVGHTVDEQKAKLEFVTACMVRFASEAVREITEGSDPPDQVAA